MKRGNPYGFTFDVRGGKRRVHVCAEDDAKAKELVRTEYLKLYGEPVPKVGVLNGREFVNF